MLENLRNNTLIEHSQTRIHTLVLPFFIDTPLFHDLHLQSKTDSHRHESEQRNCEERQGSDVGSGLETEAEGRGVDDSSVVGVAVLLDDVAIEGGAVASAAFPEGVAGGLASGGDALGSIVHSRPIAPTLSQSRQPQQSHQLPPDPHPHFPLPTTSPAHRVRV